MTHILHWEQLTSIMKLCSVVGSPALCESKGAALDIDSPCQFWISWIDSILKVGKTWHLGESQIMEVDISPYRYPIEHVRQMNALASDTSKC